MRSSLVASTILLLLASAAMAEDRVQVVKQLDTTPTNQFYPGNAEPLLPSPLIKLPVGAVRPQGWLRHQLVRMTGGFTGRLHELSRFLQPQGNAWLDPKGEGDRSYWEELPYWLKGYGDLGYLLEDQRIIQEARRWIEAAIASQREDGYFGPRRNLDRSPDVKGKPDLWPNMVMLNALQSYYEHSGDDRVPKLMARYFRWELALPEEDFLLPYWQQQRAADNLASVYWLYNKTREPWLLDLARKIHRRTANWTAGVANWHGVNISQSFRGPAVYYVLSKDPKHLAATVRDYDQVRELYGQVPGGLYGADENCRPGYSDPRQAAETCTMAEMMLSHEMLLKITGEVLWADRCEDIAFNSLPASMTADLKALRYLTAPNLVLSDRHNKAPGLQNGGAMLLYDPRSHRCCQHNVSHAWPYFTEHLWMAAPGNGLAAAMYAPCEVTAKVADGTPITITETTQYPFADTIEFALRRTGLQPVERRTGLQPVKETPVRFPLALRIPGWCPAAKLSINGKPVAAQSKAGQFLVLDRSWSDGDKLVLQLPMPITLTRWAKNKNCVSVNRGPLTYSVKIGEKIVRAGGDDKWPAVEIHPTTPWNYGLVLDPDDPARSFEVIQKPGPPADQPFESAAAPIEFRVKAKKIPNWQKDHLGLVGLLSPSPVKSDEPIETIALAPMGCCRLRIASIPVIGDGLDAREWSAPGRPAAEHRASHCFESDDTGVGLCRVPKSWRPEYRDGGPWKPVQAAGPYGTERDKFNPVEFAPVAAKELRIAVELPREFSSGILEWRVK